MKVVLARSELWRGIDTVLDAVPSKPAMPVLGNILLAANGQELGLAATDLDLSIRTHVSAAIEEPGAIAVPARTLAEIVREWPESELSLSAENGMVRLTGSVGSAEGSEGAYSLAGTSPEDFPAVPSELSGVTLDLSSVQGLDAGLLGAMIQKTAFAVARDDTRPVLNGALWRIDPQGILMVATDSHRFAHFRRAVDLSHCVEGDGRDAIVPPPAMTQMGKLLSGSVEALRITFADSQLLFDLGPTQLVSRLIQGPYVDYQQVIPRENDKRLRIASEQLLQAVRRVSILASSYTRQVRLRLAENTVELSANSPEIGGEAHEVIPAAYADEEMDIGYNAQYLMEILRRMDTSEVLFELANEVTAAQLRPADQKEGHDYFCLLMPLRPVG